MGSRAYGTTSSEMNAKRKPPRKLPVGEPRPVEHHVLTPPIERVPGLGTTWYRRGSAYWTIRVIFAFFLFLPLIIGCGMTGSVGYGLWQSGLPLSVRILLLLVIVAAIVRSSIKAWSTFIRAGRSTRNGRPMTLAEAAGDTTSPRERQRATMSAASRGIAGALGAGLSGGLLVISAIVNLGWFVVLFVSGFQRYFGGEYAARLRLQQWCDEHDVPNPLKTRQHRPVPFQT